MTTTKKIQLVFTSPNSVLVKDFPFKHLQRLYNFCANNDADKSPRVDNSNICLPTSDSIDVPITLNDEIEFEEFNKSFSEKFSDLL